MITHSGGCHCGRVRFEVDAPAELSIDDCNCSMCSRTGYLHLIVTADRFRITQGQDALTTYTFNTGTARHLFCATCGIKPFYVPRSHPDGFSVNARCIDSPTVTRHEDHAHRRPQLGKAISGRARRVHRVRERHEPVRQTTSGHSWMPNWRAARARSGAGIRASRARARARAGVDARTRARPLAHDALGVAASGCARVVRPVVPDHRRGHEDVHRARARRAIPAART